LSGDLKWLLLTLLGGLVLYSFSIGYSISKSVSKHEICL
jgi:hypothetical protein